MIRFLSLVIWGIIFSKLYAQKPIVIEEHQPIPSVTGYLTYDVESLPSTSFESIKRQFKPHTITSTYPNFGSSPLPHWIRFGILYRGRSPKTLSMITKGIDSLQVYVTNQHEQVLTSYLTGSHFSMKNRENASPFLTVTFDVQPDSVYWIWTRIRNVHYRLAASPFLLSDKNTTQDYLFVNNFFYSLYLGCMALFLLLGLVLAYFFKEKIYWYYLGCIVCALSIMLVYNDFGYLLWEHLPKFIVNKNALGVLSATVPVFYLLFAEQFLEVTKEEFPRVFQISRVTILLQYLWMAGLMAWGETLFEYKLGFYLFMGVLSTINLIYLVAKWPSPAARLFVGATLPVTITVLIETFSEVHQWPVQYIHNAYYFTTFIELLVLTGGIGYRFKKNEEDKFRLEEEKYRLQNEILKIEFDTQRRERNEIADEMHNEIGGILAASKFQVELLVSHFPKVEWESLKEHLSDAYKRVRDLSHQLRANYDDSLSSILENKYKRIKIIEFISDGLEGVRFDPFIEAQLSSIISEIITNALKHSQCTSIMVQLSYHLILILSLKTTGSGLIFERISYKTQVVDFVTLNYGLRKI